MSVVRSKFFTPPLSEAEKKNLFDVLGLSDLRFRYLEIANDFICRARQYGEKVSRPTLEPITLADWQNRLDIGNPTFVRKISGWCLEARGPSAPSLAQEIFPYPFSHLGDALNGVGPYQLVPETFASDCRRLMTALVDLEETIADCEVALIWVSRGEARFPLLIQTVRRKRVRVGTAPTLWDIGRLFDEGGGQKLTPERLFELFSTRAKFIPLSIENDSKNHVIPTVCAALERCSVRAVLGAFPAGLNLEADLQL